MIDREKIIDSDLTLARDFSSIIKWSLKKIPYLTNKWTDFTITDLGILLLTNIAYIYDNINLMLDKTFWDNTGRYTKSLNFMRGLYELMGDEIGLYESCIAPITINVSDISHYDILIPKFTRFKTVGLDKSLYFYNMEGSFIPNKVNTIKINFVEGIKKELSIRITDIDEEKGEIFINCNNLAKNVLELSCKYMNIPRVTDSFLVNDENLYFSIHPYNDTIGLIKLSRGWKKFFSIEDIINITYFESTGEKGNLGEGTTLVPDESIYDIQGYEVTNMISLVSDNGSGGKDRWDVDTCRKQLSNIVSQMNIPVSDNDFNICKDIDDSISNVIIRRESDSLKIRFVTWDGNTSQEDLENIKTRLQEYLNNIKFTKYDIDVSYAKNYNLYLDIIVSLNRGGISTAKVTEDITNVLKNKFIRSGSGGLGIIQDIDIKETILKCNKFIGLVNLKGFSSIELEWDTVVDFKGVSIEYRRDL